MALDVSKTTDEILAAMKPVLGQRWERVQEYAKEEAAKLAKTLARIELEKLTGVISEQQANVLFTMQKNASTAVFATIHGMGDQAAAQAVNAGLGVLKGALNKALGFTLL